MSLMNCDICGEIYDSDYDDYKLDDLDVCQACYEKTLEKDGEREVLK